MSSASSNPEVTAILSRMAAGDGGAAAELLPLVYAELRKLAEARMRRLPPGQTLQPTALVHEAYVKLVNGGDESKAKANAQWNGRAHFFGAAAQAMRDILVDAVRRKGAAKRGGDEQHVAWDESQITQVALEGGAAKEDLVALDVALSRLHAAHPRQAEVTMLKMFAGLTEAEIAQLHGVTERTIERDFRFAQAFLLREMSR